MVFGLFRKIRRLLLVLFLTPLLLVGIAFIFPQNLLCVDTGPTQADVIVVLGGGGGERPQRAAELFYEGVAARIILTGRGDCEGNRAILRQVNVPETAIATECDSKSTKENALFTAKMLRAMGARRVVLVTSWYHSRRALNCFEKYAPDIKFYSRPAYFAFERRKWRREGITPHIWIEYVKTAGYWFVYGVSPF